MALRIIKLRQGKENLVWLKNPLHGTYSVKQGYASFFSQDMQVNPYSRLVMAKQCGLLRLLLPSKPTLKYIQILEQSATLWALKRVVYCHYKYSSHLAQEEDPQKGMFMIFLNLGMVYCPNLCLVWKKVYLDCYKHALINMWI